MRWIARFVSIAWAFWAVFLTWFFLSNYRDEGLVSVAGYGVVLRVDLLLFVGGAITAGVWRLEALGGGVLLMTLFLVGIPHLRVTMAEFVRPSAPDFNIVTPLVVPPLVAGGLLLACHARTKRSGERGGSRVRTALESSLSAKQRGRESTHTQH